MTRIAIVGTVVVVLILILGVGFHAWLNTAIKRAVEQIGSKMTGSTVTVEDVSTAIIPGRVQMHGLALANVQGFRKPTAVKVGKATVRFEWMTVLADTVVIDEIVIDRPEFTYEGVLGRKNLKTIPEKLETFAYTGSKDKDALPTPERGNGADTKVLVREFALTNGQVTWQGRESPKTAALPDIHLTEIAKQSGGAGIQEIASAIMESIYNDVTRTVGGRDKASEQGAAEPHEPADGK